MQHHRPTQYAARGLYVSPLDTLHLRGCGYLGRVMFQTKVSLLEPLSHPVYPFWPRIGLAKKFIWGFQKNQNEFLANTMPKVLESLSSSYAEFWHKLPTFHMYHQWMPSFRKKTMQLGSNHFLRAVVGWEHGPVSCSKSWSGNGIRLIGWLWLRCMEQRAR